MCKKIEIFSDGSCLGNPGPGGYGVIIRYCQYEKKFSNGYYLTTNNRMELMAAIFALEKLKKNCNIDIVFSTDSEYARLGITKWINIWKLYGWKTYSNKLVKNIDLWQRLDIVLNKHKICWKWIKGHSGHYENEICDKLAKKAALNPKLEDIGYLYNNQNYFGIAL